MKTDAQNPKTAEGILGLVPDRYRNRSYSEKLRDDRWQDLRKRKIREHPFCSNCKQAVHVLHVHHIAYRPKAEPWEYGTHELRVLCGDCHHKMHEVLQFVKTELLGHLNIATAEGLAVNLKLLIDHHGPIGALEVLHRLNARHA